MEEKLEFMRKERLEKIKAKFTTIEKKAQKAIDKANPRDILSLKMTFNSPITITEAKVVNADDFIRMAF